MMDKLRLGAALLPAAEVGLLRALTRLLAANPGAGFRWQFVDSPPYDALVTDAGADLQAQRNRAPAILALCGAEKIAGPDCMPRPIKAEQLERWLTAQQERRPVTMISPPAASAQNPGRAQHAHDRTTYRLLKWPPNMLLQNDMARVRMATLMSRRAMSVGELANMTELPAARCQTFIQSLRSIGLLQITEIPAPPVAVGTPSATPSGQSTSRWNLVRNIRQRLGLGTPA